MRGAGVKLLTVLAAALFTAASAQVEVLEETSAYRLVRHPAGETRVPIRPERVATLYAGLSDAVLSLGLTPVAASSTYVSESAFEPYLTTGLRDAVNVGFEWEPNLEALLSAQPDLILIVDWQAEDLYEALSKIAPVVAIPYSSYREQVAAAGTVSTGTDYIAMLLRSVGLVLGMPEEAEARRVQYERKTAALGERLRQQLGDDTVAFLAVRPREIRLYGKEGNSGAVLFGDFRLNPGPLVPDTWMVPISEEVIPELRVDHLFLLVDEGAEEEVARLRDSALWSSLPAVQKGNVYPADPDLWYRGIDGPIGSEAFMDEVAAALLGATTQSTPSPVPERDTASVEANVNVQNRVQGQP